MFTQGVIETERVTYIKNELLCRWKVFTQGVIETKVGTGDRNRTCNTSVEGVHAGRDRNVRYCAFSTTMVATMGRWKVFTQGVIETRCAPREMRWC